MEASPTRSAARDALPVVFLALFTPLLLGLTRSAQQTGDALLYAYSIRTGADLFHPHHLLYGPAVRMLYLGLGRVFTPWDALAAAQLHGVLWATVAIVFFFLAARRVLGWSSLALVGALALLFTQGFWMLATHANSYVPALGSLSIVVYLLARRDPAAPGPRRLVAVSLVWGVAILYHQVNVLLAVPLVAYVRSVSGPPLLRTAWRVLLPAGAVSAAAYAAVLVAHPLRDGGGVWRFPLDYAVHPNPSWGTLRNVSLAGLGALVSNQCWGVVAIHRKLGGAIVTVLAVLGAALVVWHLRQVRRGAGRAAFRLFLLLWLGTYLSFYLWWLPQHKPFFILTSVPIVLLALLAIVDLIEGELRVRINRAVTTGVLAGVVGAVGVFHLAVVILPLHTLERTAYREAQSLDRLVPSDCYIMAPYEVAQSLRYYFDRARAAHARFPLLCTYQEQPIPEEFDIGDGECVAIATQYLRPDLNLYGYDAGEAPERFLVYLSWLFDFEYDDGRLVSTSSFGILEASTGADYVRIDPRRHPVNGLRGFLDELDHHSIDVPGWNDRPFVRWLDESGGAK